MKKAVRISVLKARQKRDTSVYKRLCNPFKFIDLFIGMSRTDVFINNTFTVPIINNLYGSCTRSSINYSNI